MTAAGYVLQVRVPTLEAVLADPDGRIWSRLSLLASVDRVDVPDDSYGRPQVTVRREPVEVEVTMASAAWASKSVVLRCLEDRVEVRARVRGAGALGEVRLLGGRATLLDGACGTFRSSIEYATVFVPTPTEPVQVVRPAGVGASLGIVGDASAGRLHGVFSPPPLCFVFGRPTGWLSAALVADVAALRFPELRYDPLDGGFLFSVDYEGRTRVDGLFETPAVVLRRVDDPWQGLTRYRDDLGAAEPGRAAWWAEPLFCGWGAQCAAAPIPGQPGSHPYHLDELGPAVVPAGVVTAFEMSRQRRYDEWLARLAEHGVVPGTVVVDDRWQLAYGTAEPDVSRWPDLRAWIAERHAAGQRVLLWWKAWDPAGLPAGECVTDPAGTPVAADPGSPAYRERLAAIVERLLGPGGLDADGFKIDFTQRSPTGRGLLRPGADPGAPWGIALLHTLLATIHRAAKRAKPDALVVTHTPHPGFGDVTDMIRLNDILERDPSGAEVPAAGQLAFRHAVVRACLPHHLIDTDQWPIGDRAQWRAYVEAQARLGVPALYYAERLDRSGEELTADDLALVARTWKDYREGRP
ncbi:hypothetical protein Ade02nite_17900 [Paractinoplanes deccanensis]|uniref:Glycoside hydrolase n=1 Tax=Paractinoplanes deccanensis TaxID=113561 RepID=A0ABQ3XZH7_9ACTN|nr:hypothetical protein [Actinoplanes deccanensis]GID73149.1 hypothetical protein Ade02nite_17900 [Actinoplanes deccanensis]